jgi:chromosome condensin MukBEF complex kleisin-like MukF subunit
MEQGILLERKVRAHTIVLGRVIRQQMAEMPFAQHHDMVEALASDRAHE